MNMEQFKKNIESKESEPKKVEKNKFNFHFKPKKTVEEVKEETPIVTEEKKVTEVETEKVENIVSETKEENIVAEVKEEIKEEPKKHRRRSTKKATDDSEPEHIVIKSADSAGLEDYTETVSYICNPIYDEDWEKDKEFITKKMNEIVISHDTDPTVLNVLIESVDALSNIITLRYSEAKSIYDSIVDKDYGLLNRVKVLNANGINAEERKMNAFNACLNYTDPKSGKTFDLFLLATESRNRLGFLEGMAKTLLCKQGLLVNLNGSLKLIK